MLPSVERRISSRIFVVNAAKCRSLLNTAFWKRHLLEKTKQEITNSLYEFYLFSINKLFFILPQREHFFSGLYIFHTVFCFWERKYCLKSLYLFSHFSVCNKCRPRVVTTFYRKSRFFLQLWNTEKHRRKSQLSQFVVFESSHLTWQNQNPALPILQFNLFSFQQLNCYFKINQWEYNTK